GQRERGRRLPDRAGADVVRISAEREGERQRESEDERDGDVPREASHSAPTASATAAGTPTAPRRGGGSAANSAPMPTTAPPAQSHETSGMIRTRIVAHAFPVPSYAARIV